MSTITANTVAFQHFAALGFTEKEGVIFLTLAELGRSTAQAIARRSKIARTTVYFVLDALVQRGMVIEEKKKGTRYFLIEKPQVLTRVVEEEKKQLQQKLRAASELEQIVAPLFNRSLFSVPALQFFEGKDAVTKMSYDYLADWCASMLATDNIWWGYQDDKYVSQYREFLEHYWKSKDKKQKVQIFSNEGPLERTISVPNRTIRSAPISTAFQSTLWVCGDYVIVIMHANRPQYAFQIKERVLARNLANVFALLWQMTEPRT
jgi:predicted transcriptional regulator